MKRICNDNLCTGCSACFNCCPNQAITMQKNEKGFYNSVINEDKCINCGLCEKVCPVNNYNSQNIINPKVYALQNNDSRTLYKSSSGGAFALFSKYILEQSGIIYGVIFNEDIEAEHSKAESFIDLEKMYSSKYVQSNTKNVFTQVKIDLEKNKKVLFSGTPCQIAGLKSFLKQDYENLFTIDIVCHGVPSPLIFEKYKNEFMINNFTNKCITNINFRSKINGWVPYFVTVNMNDEIITIPANADNYMKSFLSNLNINDSCFNCKFNTFPRVADLTIGDFWGVDNYDKHLNDNNGLSIVIINSEKGKYLFEKVKDKAKTQEVPLNIVIKYNPSIIESSKPNRMREKFFLDIKNGKTLEYCVKKYCKTPIRIVFWKLLPSFIKLLIKNLMSFFKQR